jgi:putative ABC transport system permease protein
MATVRRHRREETMSDQPGFRLLQAIALLVPWARRSDWLDEWRAELAHGYERRIARGTPGWLAALAMRARCLGAITDALWLRRANGGSSLLYNDVHVALRGIRRRPAFSAAIILTLALGIGGATTIFSVIDPLMLRPLPYPEADRLAEIRTIHPDGGIYEGVFPEAWETVRAALVPSVFERVEGTAHQTVVVTGAGEPIEVGAYAFTPGTLSLMGAKPVLGRLLSEFDSAPDAPLVALVSEGFWREQLGGDANVVGRTIVLNGKSSETFTVVGVLPESFKYPMGTIRIWIPLRLKAPIWKVNGIETIVRLQPGITREQAQARVQAVTSGRVHAELPHVWNLSVQPLDDSLPRGVGNALQMLAAAVLCVLLIACVNAANLLLVRGTSRQTELSVRRSLGATRGRLFRQLVTETIVLGLIGGMLGVLLAYVGVRAIVNLLPLLVQYGQATIAVDARVLGFSVIVSLITGLLFGAGPALRAVANSGLVRASDRSMTASTRVRHTGGALVVVELALSMMLLVGAGLLAKSFVALLNVDPGFRTDAVTVLELRLATHRRDLQQGVDAYTDSARSESFYRELKTRLQALPGVRGVTISDGVPPSPSGYTTGRGLETESGKRSTGGTSIADVVVDHDYFDVLGIRIVEGRRFGEQETRSSPRSAIIDRDFAALLWPARSPLGQRFRLNAEAPWLTVVGIAAEVKMMGPDDRRVPYTIYKSAQQETPWIYRAVAVATSGAVPSIGQDVRAVVHALEPEQPIISIEPAERLFGQSLVRQRFLLILMSVFTVIAVLLAAIGVHGVISYVVAQRTREIGLRIALGATPRSMVGVVLGGGLALALLGALLGAAAALALSRFLTSVLFGVQPTDVSTFVVVAAILTAVAGAAALLPALRAGRVSPLQALRE